MTTTTDTINDNNIEIYSTVPQIDDYLSIQGLNTKFSLNNTDFDIFIIKELIDNALDHIEENAREYVNGKRPFIHVIISEEENGEVIKIKVRNSNAGIKNIFTEERINKIFNLPNYHGSKRYRHKINRGELGDALKAILCIPYAIAVRNYNKNETYQNWNYPLEINISNDNRAIKIKINNIEKIRRKENLYIDKKYCEFQDIDNDEEEINDYNHHFTEIDVYLSRIVVDYNKIDDLLEKYAVLNTHIDFKYKLPSKKEPDFYPYTQRIKNDWRNKESIYSYTLSELEVYFQGVDKSHDNLNVYDNFIYTNFREGTTLSKSKDEVLKNLTFGDCKSDVSNINYIVQKMKDGMKPIKKQSSSLQKLDLPFQIESRKQALIQRLEDVYLIEDFIYKRFDDYYENDNDGIQFPYKLEVIIAKSPILEENLLTLIESINFSPSLHIDSFFSADEYVFHSKKYNHKTLSSILSECGYSTLNKSDHKKPYNLIIVNLISPRIDYSGHNKSKIDITPFIEIFSKQLYNFVKSASSTTRNKNNLEITDNNTYHLQIWLNERWEAVKKDPALLTTGRVTLDGVYYRLRTRLDRMGIPVKDREHIKRMIKVLCDRMGLKREQLGIIATERAQFWYKGKSYGVGIDEISNLAKWATDIVIIEKQGAVEALAPFADKQGIALLYTRGFSTEYVLELTERTESNIIVLTDLDASGLLIQTKLPDKRRIRPIYRVGIGQEMLDYFELDFNDVSETYNPQEGHYETVAKYLKNNGYNLISKELFKRIKKERVEIDSVLSNVSNEDFWDYIIMFLDKKFPYRNYNRSIDVPKYVIPIHLQKFIDNITNIIIKVQEPERQKIVSELKHTEEIFDNLEDKQNEIEDRLISYAEGNAEVKKLISMVEELDNNYFNK